jgi:hypothetical protein
LATYCAETALYNKKIYRMKDGKKMEVTGRGERRCKQLLVDLKERTGYWKLKEEAPDRTPLRTHFGRGYGRAVRQATK